MTASDTSFKQTLALLRHGAAEDEANELLTQCLQATNDTGKQSTLTIKLTIKPNGYGVVKVLEDIKATVPKYDREATVLFTDKNNQLVREDPRQQRLDLRQLESSQPKVNAAPLPEEKPKNLKTLS